MTRSHTSKLHVQMNQCLVLADASDLRSQEWQAYQMQSKKLDKSNQSLKLFQSDEMPKYQVWLESNFGSTLCQVRQAVVQIKQSEDFLEQVQTYGALLGLSESNAFRILNDAKRNGTLHELWQKLQDEQSKKKCRGPSFDDIENRFDSVFDDIFGSSEGGAKSNEAGGPDGWSGSSPKSSNDSAAKVCAKNLKSIYHKLALKLHPDYNTNPSDEHKALFQTVQSLYRFQDLEALEAIWIKLQTGPSQFFDWKTASISEIMNRRRSVEKRLRSVSLGLKSAKFHPAWGFNKKNKSNFLLSQLSRSTKSQLENDLKSAHYQLGWIKSQLQKLENKSQKNSSKKIVRNRK